VAESFERIHRSNLVGMGVLPLQFKPGHSRQTLKLDGSEIVSITGLSKGITPKMDLMCTIVRKNAPAETIPLLCRIDTIEEVQYFLNGGILHNVIRHLTSRAAA
jgi:aconitate hydratase